MVDKIITAPKTKEAIRIRDMNSPCPTHRPIAALLLSLATGVLFSPSSLAAAAPRETARDAVLNLYSWTDYFPKPIRDRFQSDTGIKVNFAVFDNPDAVETLLSVGHSGYDVVIVNASPHLAREAPHGFFTKLDKARLPNLKHADAQVMQVLQGVDPGNQYAVPWMWGTTGIMYDRERIRAALPTVPDNPLDLVMKPAIAGKFANCGISVLDSWVDILPLVAHYLGQKDLSTEPTALAAVMKTLAAIRPYLRRIASSGYFEQLANGELCLAIGYSGDAMIARRMIREGHIDRNVVYAFPREAVPLYIDTLTVPVDAPHADAALTFINYVMRPDISAAVTRDIGFATGNGAAVALLPAEVRNNPAVFPPPEVRARFLLGRVYTPEETRTFTRAWQRFKAGT